MKTALERWVFEECEALHGRGVRPAVAFLSKRILALGSPFEIEHLIDQWDQHRGEAHKAQLRASGFSDDMINTFSQPGNI